MNRGNNSDNEPTVIPIESTYTTAQVAEQLGIGKSTVSKYSRSMEANGYEFVKSNSGQRAYIEHDLIALRELKKMIDKGVDYDSAVKAVVIRYKRSYSVEIAMPAISDESRYETRYEAMKRQIDALTMAVQTLSKMLDEKLTRIDSKQEVLLKAVQIAKERDEETVKKLIELREERLKNDQQEQKKKNLFKRIFGQ